MIGVPIEDLADRVGRYTWFGQSLGRLLSGWAADEQNPRARLHFHTLGRQSEVHGFIWEVLLPDSPALAAVERIAPFPGWEGWPGAECTGLFHTFERLAVLNRAILPPLEVSLAEFLSVLGCVAEAPERRHAALALSDVRGFISTGEDLLEGLLATSGNTEIAKRLARRTVGSAEGAGGRIFGPMPDMR